MFIMLLLLAMILSILFTIEPTNLRKSYSRIDQTSIILTNKFDFTGQFSHYVAFDEIKCLCAFTKYPTHKLQSYHNPCQSVNINSI